MRGDGPVKGRLVGGPHDGVVSSDVGAEQLASRGYPEVLHIVVRDGVRRVNLLGEGVPYIRAGEVGGYMAYLHNGVPVSEPAREVEAEA